MPALRGRGRIPRGVVALAVPLSLVSVSSWAHADPSTAGFHVTVLSEYEQETVDLAVDHFGGVIDPEPEGKVVEEILILPLEVLESRDPLPQPIIDFLNVFHATTRPWIIEQEVLLREGEPYRRDRALETERNLRQIRQLSFALVVPVRGSSPDSVRALVVTKDIWSLRLNSNFRIAGGELEYLLLQPSEENLAGIHHSIAGQFTLQPDVFTLGGRYGIPRLAGSRILATASANAILNRDTGEAEGSFGELVYGQPLYSKDAEWSWFGTFSWLDEINRRHVGVELRTFDSDLTDEDDAIPVLYSANVLSGSYEVTRSFGRDFKHNVTVGLAAQREVYREGDLSGAAPAAADDFRERFLPVSDTRIFPFLQYRTRQERFARLLDVDTLALQEDFRLGHDLLFKVYPVTQALNSTRDFLGFYAGAAYTVALGDGMVRPYAESQTEIEPERLADAFYTFGTRVLSPRTGIGRLLVDGVWKRRYENYLNAQTLLGGDTRLRGYPSDSFQGESAVVANLEFRSRPIPLWTVQLSGSAFFDAGDVYDEDRPESFDIKQGVGAGIRVLFPQLNRTVFRADWGFPLTKVPELGITGPFPGELVITFEQAFATPTIPTE